MEKPSKLLLKLSQRLFPQAGDRDAFLDCLLKAPVFHPCILWCQERPQPLPFERQAPLSWQPEFVDRLAIAAKPGQHPLHQQGAFYCLDASSVFAISPVLTLPQPVSLVLDMCASPGGKSIFSWVALQPHRVVSNEVIGKRSAALISNLKRCRVQPAQVSRLDSQVLAGLIPQTADLVLVDAPCTGQSLLAKGGTAPGCFHPVTINNNANRQKRILANSAQIVAPQGHLLYMTCTYSPEENEQVVQWLLERFPQFAAIPVPALADYQSHLVDLPCYRMFPQSGVGAGAFTALLQNIESGSAQPLTDEFLHHPAVRPVLIDRD
jgi:16S rRNA C967 or C1407 C5-methylase (RsmB/RsmF family)